MSEKDDDDKNIVEKLIASIIDYSSSDIGGYERTLNIMVTSPRWQVSGTSQVSSEAETVHSSVNSVYQTIDTSDEFEGHTAEAAADYGQSISKFGYESITSSQTDRMNAVAEQANSILDGLSSQRDALPGNKLDDTAASVIRGAKTVISVAVPVLGVVLDIAGLSDPVAWINKKLEQNRENKAKEMLDSVEEQFVRLSGGSDVLTLPEAPGIPDSDVPTPSNVTEIPIEPRDVPTVMGPGTYLGDGAYDLNGDGSPDYYDYNMDGVPDIWVDSDGDGVPDIYDDYDPNNSTQNDDYRHVYEQINNNKENSPYYPDYPSGDHEYPDPNDWDWPPHDEPDIPKPIPGPVDIPIVPPGPRPDSWDIPDIPLPPDNDDPVIDIDSQDVPTNPNVPGGTDGTGSYGGSSSAGYTGSSFASMRGAGGLGAGLAAGGVTAGTIGAGVAGGGSYFTNTPVQAQIIPNGLSGATGMAAGLKSAGAAASASGASAARGGMMAPGAGAAGSGESKRKRQGMGLMTPKLEDDDIEIRSVGAMAGHRVNRDS